MPSVNADLASSSTSPVMMGGVDESPRLGPQPAVVPSGLAGRVKAGKNPSTRYSLLDKIVTFARGLLNRVRPTRQPGAARAGGVERQQAAFTQKLRDIGTALAAANATSETIRHALFDAEAACVKLEKTGGLPHSLIPQTFKQLCEEASPTQLNQLVRAFASGNPAVDDAMDQLVEHPLTAQLVVALQRALNAELSRRAETNVADELAAAVSVLESGGPAERIAAHLRLAFGSAASLVNEHVLDYGAPTDKSVRALILQHLESQPPETLSKLLAHLRQADLVRLRDDIAGSGRPIERALQDELLARPKRLLEDLQRCASDFLHQCQSDDPADHRAALARLPGLTSTLHAIENHSRESGAAAPAGIAALRTSLTGALERVITSSKLDLSTLTTDEVTHVSKAFNALGGRKTVTRLLAEAQGKAMGQCVENWKQSLSRLGAHLSSNQPEAFLQELERFAEMTHTLQDTAAAFAPGRASIDLDPVMHEAANQWLAGLSESERNTLRTAIDAVDFRALDVALCGAAEHARVAEDHELAAKLDSMSEMLSVLKPVFEAAGVNFALAYPAVTAPGTSWKQRMPESLQRAFGKLYGINLSGLLITLNAGHLNAQHTRIAAQLIERPSSTDEMATEKLGRHEVNRQFLRDQLRGDKPRITIETANGPQPLVDRTNWPRADRYKGDSAESVAERVANDRNLLVLAGYERLIEFCGGNEEEARMLSTHLHQGLNAGSQLAFILDSPLQLDNGRVGTIGGNSYGGGGDSLQFHLSRDTHGRVVIDVTHRSDGRNFFVPADGSRQVILSPDSTVVRHFRVGVVDGGLKLLGPLSYSFHLKADDFQKHYEPPTAAVIRRMTRADDSLKEILAYSARLGKEPEVKAMRAADAFHEEPNLLNAAEILQECDRGGAGLAALVPQTVREQVERATENCRQGILAAFDESKKRAEAQLLTLPHSSDTAEANHPMYSRHPIGQSSTSGSESGVAGSKANEAQEFLRDLAQLADQDGAERLGGAALIKRAEQLFRKFGAQIADADRVGALLQTVRESAEAHTFDADLFGDIAETLAQRVDVELSTPLIAAIKRGEL